MHAIASLIKKHSLAWGTKIQPAREWCGAEKAHFRRISRSPTTYFFQNGTAVVVETGERESSSIGTRESVRTRSIVRTFSPFVTLRRICLSLSFFRHEICDVISESWRRGGEASGRSGQIFSRLSQCNLQSILQLPSNRQTGQPYSATGSLTHSGRLAMELAPLARYLARLSLQSRHSSATCVRLSVYWAALTTRILIDQIEFLHARLSVLRPPLRPLPSSVNKLLLCRSKIVFLFCIPLHSLPRPCE